MWMQIQNQKGGKEGKKKCPAGLWNSFPVQCVLQQVALSPPGPSPFSAIPLGWMCNALWRLVAGALGVWGSYLQKRVEMGALLSPACAWVMVTCSMMLGVRWSQWGITTDWCSLESTTPNSCPMWGFRVFLFYVFHVETRDFSFNSSLPSTLSAMTAQLLNAYSAFRHCPNRTCDNWAALENSTAAPASACCGASQHALITPQVSHWKHCGLSWRTPWTRASRLFPPLEPPLLACSLRFIVVVHPLSCPKGGNWAVTRQAHV